MAIPSIVDIIWPLSVRFHGGLYSNHLPDPPDFLFCGLPIALQEHESRQKSRTKVILASRRPSAKQSLKPRLSEGDAHFISTTPSLLKLCATIGDEPRNVASTSSSRVRTILDR